MDDNVDADRERLQEALTPGAKKKKEMRDRDDKKFQSEEEEEVDWERLLWGEGTVDDNGQGQELQPSFLTPGANKKWGPDDQKSQMEILEADNDCWIEERKDYPQEEEDEVVDWERIHFDEGTVDDNVQGQELQPSVMGGIQMPSQIMIPSTPITPSQLPSPLVQYQLSSYLQSQQQQLQQSSHKLKVVWSNQHNEILKISSAADFKNHNLPLARIKNIMKSDEDVRMIALEVLVLFVKACEMFILELTYRSWAQTEENKRRMLMKNDIARAIQKTEVFDFLVDIVPREEPKDEMLGTLGDEYCHDQELQTTVKGGIQMPYTPAPFHTSVMMSSTTPIMPGQLPSPIVLPQLSYQQIQPQLAQQLKMFWYNQYNEILAISSANVFKDHNLSLARIKKIMKSSEDPTMKMALEAPVLFARACGMFIQELTYRAWAENVENKRQKLSKKDIARAITKSEVFDFLVDIVPRESSG